MAKPTANLARGFAAGLLAAMAAAAAPPPAAAGQAEAMPSLSGLTRFRAYPLVDRAYNALAQGEVDRACTLLEEALQVAPGDGELLVQVLALYGRIGRPERTVELASAFLARYGESVRVRAYRGFARRKLGKDREALGDFLAAAGSPALRAGEAEAVREAMLGTAVSLGDFELVLRLTAKGAPRNATEAAYRADALGRLKQPLEAAAAFDEAARLAESPKQRREMMLAQAQSLITGKDLGRARPVVATLLREGGKGDGTAMVVLNLVAAEAARGQHDAVEQDASAYLAAYGPDGRILLQRALARAQLGRPQEAVGDLSAAIAGTQLSPAERRLARESLLDQAAVASQDELVLAVLGPGPDEAYRDATRRAMALARLDRTVEAGAAYARAAELAASPAERVWAVTGLADSAAKTEGLPARRKGLLAALRLLAPDLAEDGAAAPPPAPGEADASSRRRGFWGRAAREPEPPPSEAAVSLQRALLRELSVVDERRGDGAAAMRWLRAIPEGDWARADRERLAELLRRDGKALAAADILAGIEPRDGALRLRRATLLGEAGQPGKAIDELRPMLAPGGAPAERVEAARRVAVHARATGALELEKEALGVARAIRPDDADIALTAADNAILRGDLAEADRLLRGIADHGDGRTARAAQARRAELALKQGDRPRAIALQRELVAALGPKGAERQSQLARLGRMEADAGECGAAVATLDQVPSTSLPAQDRVAQGVCLARLERWGDAAEALEQALRPRPDGLQQETRLLALDTLADTQGRQGQFAQAAATRLEAQGLAPSAERAVRRAQDLRLAGDAGGAAGALAGVDVAALDGAKLAAYHDEAAAQALAGHDAARALAASEAAARAEPTPFRWVALAEAQRAAGDTAGAERAYRDALSLDPENETALLGLAYLLYGQRRFAESIEPFEKARGTHSDAPEVRADIAYNHLALGQKQEGLRELERAIDGYRAEAVAQADPATERKLFDLRREHMYRQGRFAGDAALTIQPGIGADPSFADAQRVSGSQFGAELFWAPPVPGWNDENRFQLSARLFTTLDSDTLAPEWETTQLAVGARYRPLAGQNLVLSFERLIGLGDEARDAWLPRVMWSWQDGGYIQPFEPSWNFTSLYADLAYVWDSPSSWQALGEARQGRSFRLDDRTALTPYIVGVARSSWGSGQEDERAVEVGPGISLARWVNEGAYDAPSSRIHLDLEYRFVFGRTDDDSSVLLRLGWEF